MYASGLLAHLRVPRAACDTKQAVSVKAWLEKTMIEGIEAVLNGMDEVDVPVEVEAWIARSWGEGS